MKTQLGRIVRTNKKAVKGCDSCDLDGFGTQGEKKFLKKTTSKAVRRVAKEHIKKDIEEGD